ncbi:MAG: hypothetical protein GC159_23055 [Phycisphaera sp.]|nr:hypothetical protein [Phycisphaera sp.]
MLHVPEEHIGKKIRCTNCGTKLKVPATSTYDPAKDPELNAPQIITPGTASLPDQPFDPFAEPTGPQGVQMKCTRCDAPMSPEAVLCTNCGYSMKTGRRLSSVVKDGAAVEREEKIVFSAFGEDFTMAKTMMLAAMLCIVGLGVAWWFMGPGARAQILAVEPVQAVMVLNTIGKGGSNVTSIGGAMSAGGGSSGGGPMSPFTLGGGTSFYVIKPGGKGDHLIVKVAVSQKLMVDMKMSRANSIKLIATKFKLNNADGTGQGIPAMLLEDAYDSMYVDLMNSSMPNVDPMLPPDVEPATNEVKQLPHKVMEGTLTYDGTKRVDGALIYQKMPTTVLGPGGINAEGKLTLAHDELAVSYNYGGPTLELTWNDGAVGWCVKGSDDRAERISPTSKYEVLLLFERPTDPTFDTLWLEDEALGRLPAGTSHIDYTVASAVDPEKAHRQPVASAPTPRRTPDPTGMGTYFKLLADAKSRASSITSGSNMRQIGLAIMFYGNDHNGDLPDGLQDLLPYLDKSGAVLQNQRTGERPGYIYVKPDAAQAHANPARTAILYESRGGKRDPDGSVLYLDGHIEIGK